MVEDKTVVFFGDSMTQNLEEENVSFPDIIGENTGIQAINLGMGGTAMSVHPNVSFDSFSFHSITDAIITENYELQYEALNDTEIPEYFDEKLNVLQKIEWEAVDTIAIMYGANDWGNRIENENDLLDVTTFKGSARYSLDRLLTAYPSLEVIFIPMTYRYWPEYNNLDTDSSINAYNLKPSDYSDAMVELSKEFKFPYVDSLYSLGINKYNKELYFKTNDGTHFNELGTKKLADMISEVFISNFERNQ
ncbi:SGNH/GDSL hydrolase family protein [Marinilactibacillus sp. XAAS-LB27]|uniref:SGNH/GDSL hydrolase family protein n=1 Tax=Marinilactibacillus sp. XAAS-LB27 TaxID=3114538 RepID=UPI002E19A0DA|nr:SGNH/GDSL hydrolase family protein [Marinilactibacillus sp. XAAS-LB27]